MEDWLQVKDSSLASHMLLSLKSNSFAYYPLYANYLEILLKDIPELFVSVTMVPTFFSDTCKFLP